MAMSKEAKAARAAYMREYRRKHPEMQKVYVETHWEKIAKQKAEAEENGQTAD